MVQEVRRKWEGSPREEGRGQGEKMREGEQGEGVRGGKWRWGVSGGGLTLVQGTKHLLQHVIDIGVQLVGMLLHVL